MKCAARYVWTRACQSLHIAWIVSVGQALRPLRCVEDDGHEPLSSKVRFLLIMKRDMATQDRCNVRRLGAWLADLLSTPSSS